MSGKALSLFLRVLFFAGFFSSGGPGLLLLAQEAPAPAAEAEAGDDSAPETVDVTGVASDEEIAARLTRILKATEWFESESVRVDQGVAFLNGKTPDEKHREWAGRLAANTQDVVAVVNRIEVTEPSSWDFSPAQRELSAMGREFIRHSPKLLFALLILLIAVFLSKAASGAFARFFERRIRNGILRQIAARLIGIFIFLLGVYLVLKVSGLTRLAVTMLGGTGIIGLVIGFAFRDIAENFLASLLISMQHPFEKGDLIEVAGFQGFVQLVNTRCTVIMTLEGNHVQIPNAVIYKESIKNITANPRLRCDFLVGIGYEDSISHAQNVGLQILKEHPAVIDDPEPMILVEELGPSTVNLRFYFWIDAKRYSLPKVKSAVIRMTKRAFEKSGISMPDQAREIIFPKGVPVTMTGGEAQAAEPGKKIPESVPSDESAVSHAEGGLDNEDDEIKRQSRGSRMPEEGPNLLDEKRGS